MRATGTPTAPRPQALARRAPELAGGGRHTGALPQPARCSTLSSGASDVVAALADAASHEDETTAHVLRHTFGTTLVRGGADLVLVAELMGDARLETTRAYTRPTAEDRAKPWTYCPSIAERGLLPLLHVSRPYPLGGRQQRSRNWTP